MTISLSDAGKRFNRDWIFRHFSFQFTTGNSYAIIGPNGSGKSTLLQSIAGAVALSEGAMTIQTANDKESLPSITTDSIYQHIAIAAPYLELIEEMTATELLTFHQTFKPLLPTLDIKEMIAAIGLSNAAHKQIRYYSSGMKQRVKLAQAIFSDVPVVLLDEPCTNLDASGIALYQELIARYCQDRLVLVSSNDEAEYGFCKEHINLLQFKNG
ncbi:MAG TPA: ATP-binding cassette domain-containing protein [Chitinophagaceae bacterium]|nr:ATP-binding cassette domain-containing protein [Chitinophagaceae bacterium]